MIKEKGQGGSFSYSKNEILTGCTGCTGSKMDLFTVKDPHGKDIKFVFFEDF